MEDKNINTENKQVKKTKKEHKPARSLSDLLEKDRDEYVELIETFNYIY